jgi:RNA polymerase sigma-70 factor (sigma-E family)
MTGRIPRCTLDRVTGVVEYLLGITFLDPRFARSPMLTQEWALGRLVSMAHRECEVRECHMLSFMWAGQNGYNGRRVGLSGGIVDTEVGGFAQFVEARERALQRAAWALTGDWTMAEDLVQTALAQSWPRWERIRRRDNPEVYVRRVMVNTWVSWGRRRWRGEMASAVVPDSPAGEDVASKVVMRMAVRGALEALPRRQRAVLVLRVYDDLSEKQVAQALNCPVGTVKSAMSRALARLREDPLLAELMQI